MVQKRHAAHCISQSGGLFIKEFHSYCVPKLNYCNSMGSLSRTMTLFLAPLTILLTQVKQDDLALDMIK